MATLPGDGGLLEEDGKLCFRLACGLARRPEWKIVSQSPALHKSVSGRIQCRIIVKSADSCGVSEQLRQLGIEVTYMGKPLTDLIKQGWHILTL